MSTTIIKSANSDNQALVNSSGELLVAVSGGGGVASDVNISDSAGNPLTSTAGALNVNTTGSSTVTGTVTSVQAGLNSFQTSQYSVTTAVQQITPTPLANRSSISIRVTAAAGSAIFIGNDNTVTINSGYPLYNGDTIQMDLTTANTIYAIASAPTQTLYALEIA